jgi:hypothetical protein
VNRLRPQAPAAASPTPEQRAELAVSVLEAREHRPVTVPRTTVVGAMRLLSRRENAQVRAECRQVMEALGLTGVSIEGFTEWHEELAVRTIATAVRSQAKHDEPLAPLTDWVECDDDQINALWDAYQNLQAELDPLGASGPPLTEAEEVAIRDAAKKKAVDLLMSYGSRKLALSLISSADPSPT